MLFAALITGVLYFAYDLGYDRATTKANLRTQQMISEIEADWRKKYQDGVKKAEELQHQLDTIEVETRIIKEKVEIYVEPDKDQYCGPNLGIVGLLNDSRNPELPKTPKRTVEEGKAPSGISYSGLILDDLDTIEAYNKLMAEHNKLVEWIEENYE